MRCSIIALLAVSASALVAQTRAGDPIKTTLCELVRDPERFNNKLVEIRSEFVSGFQREGFVDETCPAKIQVGAHYFLGDLMAQRGQYAFTPIDDDNTHPERLTWRTIEPRLPIDLKQDDNYRAFRKYSDTKFEWPDGGQCQDCPLYRIILTADGRFDYFQSQSVAVRANPAEKAVRFTAGEPDLPLLWFVLQSVSDVSATPINPSSYSGKKRRDLTLEEAYGLVKAFQKDHGEGGYGLEKYEVKEYPGFQFFQAVPDAPSGHLHYPVDLRTGEVWDEASCEKLASPSLKKLQNAIRNRIGLAAEEYRKLGRLGPFCEQ
jgi:hypothetical protein